MLLKDWITQMQGTYPADMIVIPELWTEDDINKKAKEIGLELNREEINKIADILGTINVDDGIKTNWNTIGKVLSDFVNKQTKSGNIIHEVIPCKYCIHNCNYKTEGICGPDYPNFIGKKVREVK